MPCPSKRMLTAYLAPDEYETIKAAASQARLSVSNYVRLVCLGHQPKSKVDQEAVLALLQVSNNLSRLGNLLKLTLDQSNVDEAKVYRLIDSIQETKEILNEKIKAI